MTLLAPLRTDCPRVSGFCFKRRPIARPRDYYLNSVIETGNSTTIHPNVAIVLRKAVSKHVFSGTSLSHTQSNQRRHFFILHRGEPKRDSAAGEGTQKEELNGGLGKHAGLQQ